MSWRRIQYADGANNATISIVRNVYYVILENIRGDFSDNTVSYSSRTLHADPSELSRFLATRYVMFCLYSGPLI